MSAFEQVWGGDRLLKYPPDVPLGIYTAEQYNKLGERRRFLGARVAYNLLDVGRNPGPEAVRVFEDVCITLRTSNGTFRTSFRHRFRDVDAKAGELIRALGLEGAFRVEDRAVSHGLTSVEWAERLFAEYPAVTFEASDLLLYLLELSLPNGEVYMTDREGRPLQWIKPPFVVSAGHSESWRNPLLRAVSNRAKRRFGRLGLPANWQEGSQRGDFSVRRISCVHPEAVQLAETNDRFTFGMRSIFERSRTKCQVLRTMNILNRAYFSEAELRDGINAVFESLTPGGLWVVGRTLETDLSNHTSFLRRDENGWTVLDRIGSGSEIEELALKRVSATNAA